MEKRNQMKSSKSLLTSHRAEILSITVKYSARNVRIVGSVGCKEDDKYRI